MNTGPDHQPLDDEEAALARRLRALPGGTPSPELDARIRDQAHAAVAPMRPRVRPWLWGVSTAAVAVLAVGMFWQLGLPPDRLQDAAQPAQQAIEAPSPARRPAAERFEQSAMDASTLGKANDQAPVPVATTAPAEESRARAPAAERAAEAELQDERVPAAILVPPPPPAPPAPAPEPPSRRAAEPAASASAEQDAAPTLREAETAAPPRALRRAPTADVAAGPAEAARVQSIQAYARGPAADWLSHIEALLREGKAQDARAHLRAFREAHPRHPLPDALRDLLDDAR